MKIKINLSQVDKSRIVDRTYTNREGKQVIIKELSMETLPLKEPKLITEGQTWKLMKTHTVIHEQTKEEKTNKVPAIFIGEGLQFVDITLENDEELEQIQRQFMGKKEQTKSESELLAESIPF